MILFLVAVYGHEGTLLILCEWHLQSGSKEEADNLPPARFPRYLVVDHGKVSAPLLSIGQHFCPTSVSSSNFL